jgi:hypothetical protein
MPDVPPLELSAARHAMIAAYLNLSAAAAGLTAEDMMRPTRCAG